jgi:signal transduction histidine kinase
MSRISIKARLVVLCASLLGILLVSTVYLTRQVVEFNVIQTEESRLIGVVHKADRSTQTLGEYKYWLSDLAVSLLMRSEHRATAARRSFEKSLMELESFDPSSIASIRIELQAMTDIALQAIDAYTNDQRVLGNSLMAKAQVHIGTIDRHMSTLHRTVEQESAIFMTTVRTQTERAIIFSIIVVIVGTALGLVIKVFVLRSVTGPLRDLVSAMRSIAAGNLEVDIPQPDAEEFGDMARTLERFRESQIEHRRSEFRLRASEERHRQFSANVAHELRTPLAVMRSNIDILDDPSVAQSFLADVDAMTRMVEQLLAMARLDLLNIGSAETADLHRVSTNVAAHVAPLAIRDGRSIEVVGSKQPVIIRGNTDRLEQALRNLVDNALRFSPPRKPVTIKVGTEATISVVDQGPGIPPSERESIFQRFVRSDGTVNDIGLGIGLSIVRRTVEAHGGRVQIDDTPGGGATFTMKFPVAEAVKH